MKRISVYISAFAFLVVLGSCSLNNVNNNPTTPVAAFRVTHLSPNQSPLDIYLGSNLATSYLTYTYSSSYFQILPGTYTFTGDAANTKNVVVDTSVSFSSNVVYTVFIIDSAAAISTAVVQDNINASTDSAKIRILDFAPIGDTVNIATTGTPPLAVASNARIFNDQATNSSYANFFSVPAGTYTFNVVQPSTSTVLPLQAGSGTQTFQAGKVYTIVLAGLLNGSFDTQSLGIVSIPNN